jgi:uncharacterized membrane protein
VLTCLLQLVVLKKGFRDVFVITSILAIITFPFIFIGFWPAFLLFIFVAIIGFIGWMLSPEAEKQPEFPAVHVDTSKITMGTGEDPNIQSKIR